MNQSPITSPGLVLPVEKKLQERVVRYYEEAAIDYALVWQNRDNLAFHFGYYEEGVEKHSDALLNANRVLADRAQVGIGDRVLDAGCGLGGTAIWLAEKRLAWVTGVTLVDAHVQRARAIAEIRGVTDRVDFQRRDFTRTGLPSESFDAAIALESSCHSLDKRAFYKEMARLLKPGGRLVVADFILSGGRLDSATAAVLDEWLDGWSIPHLLPAALHREFASEADLVEIEVEDLTAATHRSLRRLYKLSHLGIPIDAVLHALGLRSRAQHLNVIASRRQYRALQRGAWFYGLVKAIKPHAAP